MEEFVCAIQMTLNSCNHSKFNPKKKRKVWLQDEYWLVLAILLLLRDNDKTYKHPLYINQLTNFLKGLGKFWGYFSW